MTKDSADTLAGHRHGQEGYIRRLQISLLFLFFLSYVKQSDVDLICHMCKQTDRPFWHWKRLKCSGCQSVLGKQAEAHSDTVESIRVDKFAVKFLMDSESVPIIENPFLTYFCHQLVDSARAHSTFRFIIQDEDTGVPRLLV